MAQAKRHHDDTSRRFNLFFPSIIRRLLVVWRLFAPRRARRFRLFFLRHLIMIVVVGRPDRSARDDERTRVVETVQTKRAVELAWFASLS